MTKARSELIDLSSTSYYHIMSRCVRRTFLCGYDNFTQRDYSHRKSWLIKRMKALSDIFAIKICAYAVMSNHYHLVLFVDEEQGQSWTEEEVRFRWSQLYPGDAQKLELQETSGLSKELVSKKVEQWGERLKSISWYMRCLNEPIARMSNTEDKVTGRFWEGRFKSQALLDEGALLSAMAYVDLNPIRAKIASTPEESEFTSIYERIQYIAKQQKTKNSAKSYDDLSQPRGIMPFANEQKSKNPAIEFKLSDYLQLVDATGRVIRQDKKGHISGKLQNILARLQLTHHGWLEMVQGLEQNFTYAVGSESLMETFQSESRLRKIKGTSSAKECYVDRTA